MAPARLLLVEDTFSLAALYREYLRDEGHEIRHAPTLADARAVLAAEYPRGLASHTVAFFQRFLDQRFLDFFQ